MAPPLKTSSPTPPPMKTIPIQELKTLKANLQRRHRFLGRWTAPLTGFFDGFYDSFAIANVLWLALGGILTIITPPIGLSIIALVAATSLGNGVRMAIQSYKEEKKNAEAAQALLDKAIKAAELLESQPELSADSFADTMKEILEANGITDPIELDTILSESRKKAEDLIDQSTKDSLTIPVAAEQSNPIGEKIDTIDLWSRNIRNSFGLGFLATALVYGSAAAINPIGLAAIVGGMILQLVPKILQNYFVDSHRKQATQTIQTLAVEQEAVITERQNLDFKLEKLKYDILSDALSDDKTSRSRSGSLSSSHSGSTASSAPTYTSVASAAPSYTSISAAVTPIVTTLVKPAATTVTTALSKQLETTITPADGIKRGQRYAVTLGAMHGGLHPIAWLAIAAFVASLFIPGVNVGVAIIAVTAAVGGALVLAGAVMLGARAQQKEMEAAKKEADELDKAKKIAQTVEALQSAPQNTSEDRLQPIYEKQQKYLENRLGLGSPRYIAAMKKLDEQYSKFKKVYAEETEEKNLDKFQATYNKLSGEFTANALKPKEYKLANEQPLFIRRARDFFALFETPTGALLGASIIVVGVPLILPVVLLAGIPLYVSYRKKQIDDKRAYNIGVCETVSSKLQMSLNFFKSELHRIVAARAGMEMDFKKAAEKVVKDETGVATSSTVLSSRSSSPASTASATLPTPTSLLVPPRIASAGPAAA